MKSIVECSRIPDSVLAGSKIDDAFVISLETILGVPRYDGDQVMFAYVADFDGSSPALVLRSSDSSTRLGKIQKRIQRLMPSGAAGFSIPYFGNSWCRVSCEQGSYLTLKRKITQREFAKVARTLWYDQVRNDLITLRVERCAYGELHSETYEWPNLQLR